MCIVHFVVVVVAVVRVDVYSLESSSYHQYYHSLWMSHTSVAFEWFRFYLGRSVAFRWKYTNDIGMFKFVMPCCIPAEMDAATTVPLVDIVIRNHSKYKWNSRKRMKEWKTIYACGEQNKKLSLKAKHNKYKENVNGKYKKGGGVFRNRREDKKLIVYSK